MASKRLQSVGRTEVPASEQAVTPRLSSAELKRIAGADQSQPPAVMPRVQRTVMVNFRLTEDLADALAAAAASSNTTQKVIVARALASAGLAVPAEDLEDRTKRRRRT
jgi:uncharacterized tellurite resistance protein B-like protein